MKVFQCHSGTKNTEMLNFILEHKNEKVSILYECNLYAHWGDDEIMDIFLDDAGIKKAISLINEHCIHSVTVLDKPEN